MPTLLHMTASTVYVDAVLSRRDGAFGDRTGSVACAPNLRIRDPSVALGRDRSLPREASASCRQLLLVSSVTRAFYHGCCCLERNHADLSPHEHMLHGINMPPPFH